MFCGGLFKKETPGFSSERFHYKVGVDYANFEKYKWSTNP
jgi:hypothetical protein